MTTVTLDPRAAHYFSCILHRDAEGVGGHFAAGGRLIMPDGTVYLGPSAIADFYRKLFSTTPPSPTPLGQVVEGRQVVVELGGSVNNIPIRALDHFTFDGEGKIELLTIYTQQPTAS